MYTLKQYEQGGIVNFERNIMKRNENIEIHRLMAFKKSKPIRIKENLIDKLKEK